MTLPLPIGNTPLLVGGDRESGATDPCTSGLRSCSARGSPAMKILICEDNPIVAMDLGWMLQDMGHRVCGTATTSVTGMEQFALKQPDVVLVDLKLADGSTGLGLVEALAQLRVPTIIVTGETQAVPRSTSAKAVIGKPFDEELLAQALAAVEARPPSSASVSSPAPQAGVGVADGAVLSPLDGAAQPRRNWWSWLWRQEA